jgi:hypothetical protein
VVHFFPKSQNKGYFVASYFFLDLSMGNIAQTGRRGPKISARAEKSGMNIEQARNRGMCDLGYSRDGIYHVLVGLGPNL